MNLLISTLRIVRFPNIIIIGLTTYFIRIFIFSNAYSINGVDFFLNNSQFILLTIAIILATTGGYLINDIYDRSIDQFNAREKVYIGNRLSLNFVVFLYILINIIGLIVSFIVAIQIAYLQWLFLYPLAAFILWFYSYFLKNTVLWGNIVVAIFCSFVVLLIWFSEKESMQNLFRVNNYIYNKLVVIIVFYSLFAFLSTIFREIIKDIQDIEGDRLNNCKTLAVKYGIPKAKFVSIIFAILLLFIIGVFFIVFKNNSTIWGIFYGLFFLITPIIYTIFLTVKAEEKSDFKRINRMGKIIMFLGLLYLPVLSFL